MDLPDQFSIRRKHMYSVVPVPSPYRRRPHISIHIATYPVGISRRHIGEKLFILQSRAIHVVHPDRLRIAFLLRHSGIHDVYPLLLRRKTQAVRLVEIAHDHRRFPRLRVQPVHIRRQFERRAVSFVIPHNSVARIGEPDRSVRVSHQIIRRVQLLPLKSIHQHRHRSVVLGPRHSPCIVFAGDQSPLAVPRISIAEIRWTPKNAHLARFFRPSQHPVTWNITKQQISPVSEPYRPFRPTRSRPQTLHRRVNHHVLCEPRINHFDRRIRVGYRILVFLPALLCRIFHCHCRRSPSRQIEEFSSLHSNRLPKQTLLRRTLPRLVVVIAAIARSVFRSHHRPTLFFYSNVPNSFQSAESFASIDSRDVTIRTEVRGSLSSEAILERGNS